MALGSLRLRKGDFENAIFERVLQSSPLSTRGVCYTKIHMGPEPKSCSWVYLVRNVVKNLNLTNFYVDNLAI